MGQNSAKSLGIATEMAAIHLGYLPSQPVIEIPSITFLTKFSQNTMSLRSKLWSTQETMKLNIHMNWEVNWDLAI